MGYLAIVDSLGKPIEIDGGLYHRFKELEFPDDKAAFMRDYRLLPCDRTPFGSMDYLEGRRDLFVCEDEKEYDAMRSVMETCERLAVFGGYGDYSKSKRKPKESDLEQIDGFETSGLGGFLRINLLESYWYRRFLFGAVISSDNSPGDNVYSPVCNYDMERKYQGGTFGYAENINGLLFGNERAYEFSKEMRREFMEFAESPGAPDIVFWSDAEMIVRSKGKNLEEIAANIAAALLTLHTDTVKSFFSFDVGYWLAAPLGVSALWSDFALCIAKRPITICQECGKPIVENHPPRGVARKYCNQKCRKRDKRREKREEIEKARKE